MVEGFAEVEVIGIVDREFGAEAAAFFEVLLEMGVLVLDVETRLDAVGDDRACGSRRRAAASAREPTREEQADAIGRPRSRFSRMTAFEEMAALDRTVEDLGQTDFELADRDAMIEAGGPVGGAQRPGQAVGPAVEELLQVAGTELVTDRLQTRSDRRTRGSRCRDW